MSTEAVSDGGKGKRLGGDRHQQIRREGGISSMARRRGDGWLLRLPKE